MLTLIFLILIFILGQLLLLLIKPRLSMLETTGLSFLLGAGVYNISYFVLVSYQKVFFSSPFLLLISEIILLLLLLYPSLNIKKIFKKPALKISALSKFLIFFLFCALAYVYVQSIYWPPFTPDAIHLYDFRAQRLLENKGHLTQTFFYHKGENYPPFTSIFHYFIRSVGSYNPKLIYPILLTFFLITLTGYMTRKTKKLELGLITSLSTLITPIIFWKSFMAITNIVYMDFFALSIIYLFDGKHFLGKPLSHALLTSFLLVSATWVRLESFWIIVFLMGIYLTFVFRNIILPFLIYIFPYLVSKTWATASEVYRVPTSFIGENISTLSHNGFSPESIKIIIFTFDSLKKDFAPLLITFLLFLIINYVFYREKPTLFDIFTLLLVVSIFIGMLIVANRFHSWNHLSDSICRMASFLIPLIWVSVFSSPVWKSNIFSQDTD